MAAAVADDDPDSSLEAKIHLSLSTIEQSLNSLAAEQHEMHNLLKGMQSGSAGGVGSGALGRENAVGLESEARRTSQRRYVSVQVPPIQAELQQSPRTASDGGSNPPAGGYGINRQGSAGEGDDANAFTWNQNWPKSLQLWPQIAGLSESKPSKLMMSKSNTRKLTKVDSVYRKSHCIILPASRLRFVLDILGLTLLAYDLAWTPVQLAWNWALEGWVFAAAIFVSTFWTLDIFAHFRTAYYTKKGDLQTDALKIAKHYICRQFIFDILVSGCDWTSFFVGQFSKGFKLARAVKLIRLARLLRILKLDRFEDFVNTLGIGPEIVESIKISAFTCWLAHFISCAWFALGTLDESDTGYHWVHQKWMDNAPTFENTGLGYQYFSTLQWTLSTMVSGTSAILPVNSLELIFSCVCILVGLLVQAFVVSILSSSAVEQKERKRYLTANLTSLEKFCLNNKVKADLWLLARSQVRASFVRNTKARLGTAQVECLQKLSSKIRTEILYEVFEPHLSRHALFLLWSLIDRLSLLKLTKDVMQLSYLQSGHDIFMAGDIASSMYMLSRGRAKYSQDPESSKVTEAQVIEVILNKWFCEPAIWMDWSHVGTMEATTDECEIHSLNALDFVKIVEQARHLLKQVVHGYAVQYHKRIRQSVPPLMSWPNDVEETCGTTFFQILASLPLTLGGTISLTAIDNASNLGLATESQFEFLQDEVREGLASAVLIKAGYNLSLQRVVSVARMVVTRFDDRCLMQLCRRSDDNLRIDVFLPGTKQRSSEDIFSTLRRLSSNMRPVVGEVEMAYIETSNEVRISKKCQINTNYSFFDAHVITPEVLVNVSSMHSSESPVRPKRRSFFKPAKHSFLTTRAGSQPLDEDAISELKARLLSGSELFFIQSSPSETNVWSWLSEDEIDFLKTRSGADFVKNIMTSDTLAAIEANGVSFASQRSSQVSQISDSLSAPAYGESGARVINDEGRAHKNDNSGRVHVVDGERRVRVVAAEDDTPRSPGDGDVVRLNTSDNAADAYDIVPVDRRTTTTADTSFNSAADDSEKWNVHV